MWRVMAHDDDYYGSENSDHHVRLVWAKAPGVMCLLPPRHQADDEDEVNQNMMTMGSKATWVKTANVRGALPGKDYEFQPELKTTSYSARKSHLKNRTSLNS